jgi:hypothetical protein
MSSNPYPKCFGATLMEDSSLPTKDEFAKLLMDRICQAGEKNEIIYDPQEFCLHGASDQHHAIFLSYALAEYRSASEEKREEVLTNWMRDWFLQKKPMGSMISNPTLFLVENPV